MKQLLCANQMQKAAVVLLKGRRSKSMMLPCDQSNKPHAKMWRVCKTKTLELWSYPQWILGHLVIWNWFLACFDLANAVNEFQSSGGRFCCCMVAFCLKLAQKTLPRLHFGLIAVECRFSESIMWYMTRPLAAFALIMILNFCVNSDWKGVCAKLRAACSNRSGVAPPNERPCAHERFLAFIPFCSLHTVLDNKTLKKNTHKIAFGIWNKPLPLTGPTSI